MVHLSSTLVLVFKALKTGSGSGNHMLAESFSIGIRLLLIMGFWGARALATATSVEAQKHTYRQVVGLQ